MFNLKEIEIEYKLGVIFGITALFLSFFVGVFSGIEISLITARALIFMLSFAFLGFAGVFVIKRYVPEIYEIINSSVITDQGLNSTLPVDKNQGAGDIKLDSVSDEAESLEASIEEKSKDGDEEIEDISLTNKANSLELDSHLSSLGASDSGGNQIILGGEDMSRYEPKVIAKAIRTMMTRDEK